MVVIFPNPLNTIDEWIAEPVESYVKLIEDISSTEKGITFFFIMTTADTTFPCCHH